MKEQNKEVDQCYLKLKVTIEAIILINVQYVSEFSRSVIHLETLFPENPKVHITKIS